jgi:hypothetical protein
MSGSLQQAQFRSQPLLGSTQVDSLVHIQILYPSIVSICT